MLINTVMAEGHPIDLEIFKNIPYSNIPPFLLIHTKLNERHHFQAIALAKALQNTGIYAQIYHTQDKDHVTLNNDPGKAGDNTTRIIFQFLSNVLNDKGL